MEKPRSDVASISWDQVKLFPWGDEAHWFHEMIRAKELVDRRVLMECPETWIFYLGERTRGWIMGPMERPIPPHPPPPKEIFWATDLISSYDENAFRRGRVEASVPGPYTEFMCRLLPLLPPFILQVTRLVPEPADPVVTIRRDYLLGCRRRNSHLLLTLVVLSHTFLAPHVNTAACISDPRFQPDSSSTYKPMKCNPSCNCDDDGKQCTYERRYAEMSSSTGVLAEDIISFGNESVLRPQRAVFGCENSETGTC
ncbi:hypothetical protein OROMI_000675 [Orobanche minor]